MTAPLNALAKDRYSEALYDIPIMPGLEEVQDQALLFDKPDGKIASVMALSKTLTPAQTGQFYKDVLPPLGWREQTTQSYTRAGEKLEIRIEENPPYTVLYLGLSPNKAQDK